MRKITLLLAVLLSGCVVTPYHAGMVVGPPGPGYSTTVVFPGAQAQVYVPNEARDYLSEQYFFYGPVVNILLPSMIYGSGWQGRGYYHVRPYQRYTWYGQEERWHGPGHK